MAQPSFPHGPDRERVREQHRALDGAELHELREARGLAVAVHDVAAAEHLVLVEVAPVRQDRSDAGAQAVALGERAVANEHPGNVDERVQLARREAADRIPQVT
jgi:hypothetical protein